MERVDLGTSIWRLRIEWRDFGLWNLKHIAIHFAATSLIDLHRLGLVEQPCGFEHIERTDTYGLKCIYRLVKETRTWL